MQQLAVTAREVQHARKFRDWLARLYKKNYGIHPSKEPWNKVTSK